MKPVIKQPRFRSREASKGLDPRALQLSNGRYTVRINRAGCGDSALGDIAISRGTTDETREANGFFLYLRDLDDGAVWSSSSQPTCATPEEYEFHCRSGLAEFARRDYGIECQLSIGVASQHDLEIRRCVVTNSSDRVRRLELTSYLEWVLCSPAADANHPAFSKLFVETQLLTERGAILARRRPRHADESEFWGMHAVVLDDAELADAHVEFETNRMRFIGRGKTVAAPAALQQDTRLSGDGGEVLDPIASLRVHIELEVGESQEIFFLLGGASSRKEIDELLDCAINIGQVRQLLANTSAATILDEQAPAATNGTNGHVPNGGLIFHNAHHLTSLERQKNSKFRPAARGVVYRDCGALEDSASLQFDNGYGGFAADGREYVIRLVPDGAGGHRRPPMPWTNVIANEQAGFLVTEGGAGYTWSGNSRQNRLTAWHNDPVCDPHSEAIWIRDDDASVFWSPTPGPTPAPSEYRVRHGFGYTVFEHTSHELSQEITMFMDRDEPLKFTRVRIVNRSTRSRSLSLFSYLHWALGCLPGDSDATISTDYDADRQIIWASNPERKHYGSNAAFSAVVLDDAIHSEVSHSCHRRSFLGPNGNMKAPAAIASFDELDRVSGKGPDPCAAWQLTFGLLPGETFECTFLLGEERDRGRALKLIGAHAGGQFVRQALAEVTEFWRHSLSAIEIETPDREIDLMVNGWLSYQNLSCRMWGRSAYYQPGGAFGFRDQLQDSAAPILHQPEITRTQILRHASQQFVEGDVLHWWHPDTGYGLRTRFSDDLLWLPLIAAEYVQRTGDAILWDEDVPFITAAPLAAEQQEAYLRPELAGETASLYEHCCRALDRGLTTGAHGLPLIGCGDWNDGFSSVGRHGKGESVWLGFFIDSVLQRMLPICAERGDGERLAHYSNYREQLREALNSTGWDGSWYRRAYYDNGQPIGSATSDECQIDALAQAWAVISGVAPPDRAEMAMDAVDDRLVCEDAGMIRLLTPAFDRTANDPGYIKGYLPGIRENGGQYTHGVLWVVRAMAELGRGTRAVKLLQMLTPIWHSSTSERVDVYKTEPYVVAADVYGEPPHVGRGGWTWYTGSAGWMFRVAVESIFGMSTDGGHTLIINPSISSKWPCCRLTYRLPDGHTKYEVVIENPRSREHGVEQASLDGQQIEVANECARVYHWCVMGELIK